MHFFAKFASKLGLINTKILSPKKEIIKKLSIFTPLNSASMLREQLWLAGAGSIGNYENCSFSTTGIGTFKGNQLSNPSTGKKGELHTEEEIKIEVTFPFNKQSQVISAMYNYHPYEEVLYVIISAIINKLELIIIIHFILIITFISHFSLAITAS